MQEKIKEIAARIRELRALAGLSAEAVAGKIGVTATVYAAFESGAADIPASMLHELAQVLGTDMAVLLTGDEPRLAVYSVTRRDKGVKVERRQDYQYQALAPHFLHKKAEPFVVVVEPKQTGDRPHMNTHPGQEFDFVLEGTLKVHIHKSELLLEAGDSIWFDSGHDHAMEAVGDKPARFLALIL